jgi:hypothetical protein
VKVDPDELLRSCSPEFQEQVKRDKESADKESKLRSEQEQRAKYWADIRSGLKALWEWMKGAAMVLGIVYVVVKFIKWAWYN